jgi:hypothetical protein
MKNSLIHRTIQLFFGIVVLFVLSNSLNAQTGTISVKLFHNTTTTANSRVTYSLNMSNGWFQGVSSVTSVVLKNLATGANTYTTYTGYSSFDSYETLPGSYAAGSYELKIIVSTRNNSLRGMIAVTCVQNIWIGNKVNWENCFDMEPSVSQYSLKRSKTTAGQTYSYAQSFNSLASGALGWVEMRKLNSNVNDSHVFMVLESLADPRTFTPTSNVTYVDFYRDNTGTSRIKIRYRQTNGVYRDSVLSTTVAISTDKVRFQRNTNDTAIIQINSSLTRVFKFPSAITGALKITILGKQLNDQADEISTSYSYPSSNYPITTRFHANNTENANTGSITTIITPLSGFSSPYNYFVTASPMDDMKSIYKYLKDSIYTGGVDSTTFFRGSTGSTTLTSPLLPSGSYYANVFDSKGVRMFTNKQELMPSYVYGQQNKFENSYNEFMSTSPDSYITLNTYVTEEDRGSLVYYIKNTTDDQSFGVLGENSTISGGGKTYSNIIYGFSVSGSQLFPVVNGVTGTPVTVLANVPIELVFADGMVSFRQNGTELKTEALPSTFTYKSGAYIKSWGVPITINPINLKFRPYKIATLVNDNACGKNSGDLKVTFTGLNNMSIHSNTSFALKNITDDANATPPTTIATVVSGTTYQDLAAGVYSLEGNLYLVPTGSPAGTAPTASYLNIKQVIYIGPRMSWDPYENIQTWPQSNTATHYAVGSSAVTNTNTAKAVATNILDPQVSGWTVFTASQFTQTDKYAQFFLNEAPIMASLNSFEWTMPCVSFYGGVVISVTSANSGPASVSIIPNFAPSVPLLIRRASNGYVRYRQNYTMLREVTNYTNARWKPAFFSQFASTGIREVYSSFQCKPYTTDMYAQLKYDMDGYYHIMKNGDINFVFNQEYNSADLVFNLYNSNDVLIKTQADFPAINTTNGLNYRTIVVRDSYCIGAGFFYLEVINSKKEKMYLRFYNDFTGCIPTMEGNGQGFGQ